MTKTTLTCEVLEWQAIDPVDYPHSTHVGSEQVECGDPATHLILFPNDDPLHDEFPLDSEEAMVKFVCENHIVEEVHEAKQCVGHDEAVFVIKIESVEQVN